LIKTLLIGYGYWGEKIFNTIKLDSRYSIESIVDLKPIKIENSTINIETNIENVLLYKKFDLAIVATNPNSHFEITKKVLENSINCLVEKPISLNLQDLEELYSVANRFNVKLLTDYTYLYTEEFKSIKSEIENIGNIFSFDSTRTNLGIIQKDINVFWDLAVHDLAIIYSLFPNLILEKVVSFGQIIEPSNVISDGTILLKFKNRFQAKVRVSWHTSIKSRDIKIFGDKGSILWNDLDKSRGLEVFYSNMEPDIDRRNVDYMQSDGVIKKIPQVSALYNEFDFIYNIIHTNHFNVNETHYNLNRKITSTLVAIDDSLKLGGAAISFE
jgi:predicted dehydrogenase